MAACLVMAAGCSESVIDRGEAAHERTTPPVAATAAVASKQTSEIAKPDSSSTDVAVPPKTLSTPAAETDSPRLIAPNSPTMDTLAVSYAKEQDTSEGVDQPDPAEAKTEPPPRADAKNADGTYGKDHVDPVQLNGPIFENWPKPKVALLFSGAQNGYIEPCGCAGLENQKGGLSRRHQLIKMLRAKQWPLLAFDAGGHLKRHDRQQELKFASVADALRKMDYSAVGFGGEDLRLPVTELISAITNAEGQTKPFVATNAALLAFEDALVPRQTVVEAGGLRFGVLAVVGQQDQQIVNNAEVHFKPADKAVAEMLPALKQANCDRLILLAHTTMEEATGLAEKFPELDFVVTTGGADEPPSRSKTIGRKTQLIEVGHKGMYCVVLGLYDGRTPVRYQRVPLDARFGESKEMDQVLVDYQKQLQDFGLAGLGLTPPTGLTRHSKGQNFVGSATCGECHTQAYAVWQKTPHAHATDSIVNASPPRHHDPECLSCHVTGWNPQGYVPYASGYLDLRQKHLHSNGCENCHGPGSRHAAAQAGEVDVTDKELKALQLSMRITKEQAKKNLCVQCHDADNSPHYTWEEYWPQVEHHGKD
jgi:hypothetical protein